MTEAMMRLNAISNLREHWGWFLALGIIFILAVRFMHGRGLLDLMRAMRR